MERSLPVLASTDTLVVQQQREMVEIFTDWETANRYAVKLPDGQTVLFAGETGHGVWASIVRAFWKAGRPFELQLRDAWNQVHLQISRPFTFFFARVYVRDGHGQIVGRIRQRFSILRRRFTVEDGSGQPLAEIVGPLWRPWTFHVRVDGDECGVIRKQWGGVLREAFTDADTFGVQFTPRVGPALRSLVLAATFLIDFCYFEDRG